MRNLGVLLLWFVVSACTGGGGRGSLITDSCTDDQTEHGNAEAVAGESMAGTFDLTETCGEACPATLRAGAAPDQPCTSSSDCAQTCCTCGGDQPPMFAAAACLGGTCRYPETACHVAWSQSTDDACQGNGGP